MTEESDLEPETKVNLGSELKEYKSQKLNINAPIFIPKKLGVTEKKNDNSDKSFNLNSKTSNFPQFTYNIINQSNYTQPYYSPNPFQISQYQNQDSQTNKNSCSSKIIENNEATFSNSNDQEYFSQNLIESTEKEEKRNVQKKKSNLFKLLESKEDYKKTKQKGNDKSENTQNYKYKKKQKLLIEQKIDQINIKKKKWKEEEIQRSEELANKEIPNNSMENLVVKGTTKLEDIFQDDPVKKDLREFLNMLTKDNYEKIKQEILDVIRDNVEYQMKFLDILFKKAISERLYVRLYAKLCKELDKELPQKNAPKERKNGEKKKPKVTSIMRAKLLDKCKEIFQIKKKKRKLFIMGIYGSLKG